MKTRKEIEDTYKAALDEYLSVSYAVPAKTKTECVEAEAKFHLAWEKYLLDIDALGKEK